MWMVGKRQLTALTGVALLFGSLRSAAGCPADTLYPGQQVRFRTAGRYAMTGSLVSLDSHAVVLRIGATDRRFFLGPDAELQVMVGYRTNGNRGALLGSLAGGLILGIAAYEDASESQDEWLSPSPSFAFRSGAIVGCFLGAAVGGIIGKGIVTPNWRTVDLRHVVFPQFRPKPAEQTSLEKRPPRSTAARAWKISFALGVGTSRPARDVENAMSSAGWNETKPIYPFTFAPFPEPEEWKRTPYSCTSAIFWSLRVRKELSPGYGVVAAIAGLPQEWTEGYRENTTIRLLHGATAYGVGMAFRKTGKIELELSGGPALVIARVEQEFVREQTRRLPGLFAVGSVAFPPRTRFCLFLDVQLWLMGNAEFGPFRVQGLDRELQLDRFRANFSDIISAAGIGIRL